ncbi:MAG: hypothetical protein V1787_02555 [Candidatus Micrarchaeota archaeon]
MNLKIFFQAFVILLAVSLLGYGLSVAGVPGTAIDSFWKLIAFDLGIAIVASYLLPYIRGVRKGDQLAANVMRHSHSGDILQAIVSSYFVTALENGRVGQKIRVRLANHRTGEGVVTSYAGTFSPAQIRLTESEM